MRTNDHRNGPWRPSGFAFLAEKNVKKQAYINNLKSSTSICSNDKSKGFKTNDNNLSICYDFKYGSNQSPMYYPRINISGYGNISGQQMVFLGSINIYDDSVGNDIGVNQKAVKDGEAGKPSAKTAEFQKSFLDALKQTTVTPSLR